MTALQGIALLLVGTVAGFDLVSGPQILLARPIVVGALSGAILGDVPAGLLVGGTMELFALEVLPVGATRYPDHGPGTVAGVWLCSALGIGGVGFGVLASLAVSELGGFTLLLHRRVNGRALVRAGARLEAGDPGAATALQAGAALRDLLRSLVLTLIGFGVAWALRGLRIADGDIQVFGPTLWGCVLAFGLAGAVAGAFRTAGRTARGVILVMGLIAGWFVAGGMAIHPFWEGR